MNRKPMLSLLLCVFTQLLFLNFMHAMGMLILLGVGHTIMNLRRTPCALKSIPRSVRRVRFWIGLTTAGIWCIIRTISTFVQMVIASWCVNQSWRSVLRSADFHHATGRFTRDMCVSGGAAFVKFAQLISGRDKEFAPAFLVELKELQEHVPSHMDAKTVQSLLPQHPQLVHVDQEPIACGCSAQVHAGLYSDDESSTDDKRKTQPFLVRHIALKVKSIYLEETIEDSFAALLPFCILLVRIGVLYCREDKIVSLLDDLRLSLSQQLDMERERQNQEFIARRFARNDHRPSSRMYPIRIARTIPNISSNAVLAMEYIHAPSLREAAPLLSEEQRHKVAETFLHFFYNATFSDHYLHPDLHAGNIKVLIHDIASDNIEVVFLDFGLAYRLTPKQVQSFAQFCSPFLEQDEEKSANWMFNSLTFNPRSAMMRPGLMEEERNAISETIRVDVRRVVHETLCGVDPSWLACVKAMVSVFEIHACSLNSKADHFLLALGHLETTTQLFITNNIVSWMIQNANSETKEGLRDIAEGELHDPIDENAVEL